MSIKNGTSIYNHINGHRHARTDGPMFELQYRIGSNSEANYHALPHGVSSLKHTDYNNRHIYEFYFNDAGELTCLDFIPDFNDPSQNKRVPYGELVMQFLEFDKIKSRMDSIEKSINGINNTASSIDTDTQNKLLNLIPQIDNFITKVKVDGIQNGQTVDLSRFVGNEAKLSNLAGKKNELINLAYNKDKLSNLAGKENDLMSLVGNKDKLSELANNKSELIDLLNKIKISKEGIRINLQEIVTKNELSDIKKVTDKINVKDMEQGKIVNLNKFVRNEDKLSNLVSKENELMSLANQKYHLNKLVDKIDVGNIPENEKVKLAPFLGKEMKLGELANRISVKEEMSGRNKVKVVSLENIPTSALSKIKEVTDKINVQDVEQGKTINLNKFVDNEDKLSKLAGKESELINLANKINVEGITTNKQVKLGSFVGKENQLHDLADNNGKLSKLAGKESELINLANKINVEGITTNKQVKLGSFVDKEEKLGNLTDKVNVQGVPQGTTVDLSKFVGQEDKLGELANKVSVKEEMAGRKKVRVVNLEGVELEGIQTSELSKIKEVTSKINVEKKDSAINLKDIVTKGELSGIMAVMDKINVKDIPVNNKVDLSKFVDKEEKLGELANKINVKKGKDQIKVVELEGLPTSELPNIKKVTDKINVQDVKQGKTINLNKFVDNEDKLSKLAGKESELINLANKINVEGITTNKQVKLGSFVDKENQLSNLASQANKLVGLVNKISVNAKGNPIELGDVVTKSDLSDIKKVTDKINVEGMFQDKKVKLAPFVDKEEKLGELANKINVKKGKNQIKVVELEGLPTSELPNIKKVTDKINVQDMNQGKTINLNKFVDNEDKLSNLASQESKLISLVNKISVNAKGNQIELGDVVTKSDLSDIKKVTDKINVDSMSTGKKVDLTHFVDKEKKLGELADIIDVDGVKSKGKQVNLAPFVDKENRLSNLANLENKLVGLVNKISVNAKGNPIELGDVVTKSDLSDIKKVTDKINVEGMFQDQKVKLAPFVDKEEKLGNLANKVNVQGVPQGTTVDLSKFVGQEDKLGELANKISVKEEMSGRKRVKVVSLENIPTSELPNIKKVTDKINVQDVEQGKTINLNKFVDNEDKLSKLAGKEVNLSKLLDTIDVGQVPANKKVKLGSFVGKENQLHDLADNNGKLSKLAGKESELINLANKINVEGITTNKQVKLGSFVDKENQLSNLASQANKLVGLVNKISVNAKGNPIELGDVVTKSDLSDIKKVTDKINVEGMFQDKKVKLAPFVDKEEKLGELANKVNVQGVPQGTTVDLSKFVGQEDKLGELANKISVKEEMSGRKRVKVVSLENIPTSELPNIKKVTDKINVQDVEQGKTINLNKFVDNEDKLSKLAGKESELINLANKINVEGITTNKQVKLGSFVDKENQLSNLASQESKLVGLVNKISVNAKGNPIELGDVVTKSDLSDIKKVTDKINVESMSAGKKVDLTHFVDKEKKLGELADIIDVDGVKNKGKQVNLAPFVDKENRLSNLANLENKLVDLANKININRDDKMIDLKKILTKGELSDIQKVTGKINVEGMGKDEKVILKPFVDNEEKLGRLAGKESELIGLLGKIGIEENDNIINLKNILTKDKLSDIKEVIGEIYPNGVLEDEIIGQSKFADWRERHHERAIDDGSDEIMVDDTRSIESGEIKEIQTVLSKIKSSAPYLFEGDAETFSAYGEWF